MARTQQKSQRNGLELVLYWTASPSTRCVLVTAGDGVDLHLIRGSAVERRTEDVDPRIARDIARRWQVEYEIERRRSATADNEVCAECGDETTVGYITDRGALRRLCQSCGHEWSVAAGTGR